MGSAKCNNGGTSSAKIQNCACEIKFEGILGQQRHLLFHPAMPPRQKNTQTKVVACSRQEEVILHGIIPSFHTYWTIILLIIFIIGLHRQHTVALCFPLLLFRFQTSFYTSIPFQSINYHHVCYASFHYQQW